jgi:hypothetical protein
MRITSELYEHTGLHVPKRTEFSLISVHQTRH